MKTDNKTLHGIKSDAERGLLIFWSLITLVSSLLGDTTILVATLRYRAIKQHKVIVAVIQHLAICDLIQVVSRVIPVTMAMIMDDWIVGEFLCHVQDNSGWISAVVTLLLTCTMTTLKFLTTKHPLKIRSFSSKFGHGVCLAVWLLVLVIYSPVFIVKMKYLRDTIHFSYSDYECNYGYTAQNIPDWYETYFLVLFPVITVLSYTTLIITSVLLLIVARRFARGRNQTLRKEGVITVLLTVIVLFISYLPLSLTFLTWLLGVYYSDVVWRVVCYVQYLNIMANFYIYCISVRSFRMFIRKKICGFLVSSTKRRGDIISSVAMQTSSSGTKTHCERSEGIFNIIDTTI